MLEIALTGASIKRLDLISSFNFWDVAGSDRSIQLEDFQAGRAVNRRYRNRRIGEFLKELDMTEGRSTGIPKILKQMATNSSPAPLFVTDDDRLSFVIRLARHRWRLSRQAIPRK